MLLPIRFVIAALLAAEVLVTVLVAGWIGALWTIILLAAAFLLGLIVMRRAGSQAGAVLRGARAPRGAVAGDTVLLFLAGLLLVVPGFLGDVVALLLLVPFVRRLVRLGIVATAARRFPKIRSAFTTIRLADDSVVIPGEVVDPDRSAADGPGQQGRRNDDGRPGLEPPEPGPDTPRPPG